MSNASENPPADDVDEYIAECDEHLSIARKVLLDIEAARDLAAVGREPLDALFRAFHTIKGLSGMVGARTAEEVAHQIETYLGALRRGDTALTESGVDALLEAVRLIEAAADGFHRGGAPPDTADFTNQVAALLPTAPATQEAIRVPEIEEPPVGPGLAPEKQARLKEALRRGARAWQVWFTPNAALAAQGVSIGTVRARLQAAADIIDAEPVSAPGGVRFRFLVAAAADTDWSAWTDVGVVLEPFETPSEAREEANPSERRPAGVARGITPSHLVRVDLGRLDDLLQAVGELVLSRARLQRGLERIATYLPLREHRNLEETGHAIERQLRDLREGIMRVRMVPVGDLFTRMRLVVRDLVRQTGKEGDLTISGEHTEVDKYIVERMADPLLHLVRNAVSHGLERSEERVAAGKSPRGRIALRAAAAAGTIVLEIEDDGRGIRTEEVLARGRDLGLIPANTAADSAALLDLICTPGFSMREQADRASGRGVGMDVVRLAVEGLGGSLALETQPTVGTRFTIRLPLTMLVADVLTVAVGEQMYAVPQTAVREVMLIEPDSTTTLEKNELVRYHGRAVPLVRIGDLFGSARPVGAFVGLVTGEGPATVALAADRALGLREVVVRSLTDPLVQVPGIGGATEMGDGRPILILDPVGLVRLARRTHERRLRSGE